MNPTKPRSKLVFGRNEDDLAGFDELQFFAREFLNRIGIAAQSLDIGVELFVLGFEFGDFGIDGSESLRAGVHLKGAAIVEYGKQKHGDRQQAENGESDSNDDALH